MRIKRRLWSDHQCREERSAAVARLVGMRTAREYLELASHCESEAAKAQDKFSRDQLLSFAESYRMLAVSAAASDRSAKFVETH